MQKIQQLFVYFEYFTLRKYFKEYFVLEYSKIKLAHTHILYQEFSMITFWNVLTMSNSKTPIWSHLRWKEA